MWDNDKTPKPRPPPPIPQHPLFGGQTQYPTTPWGVPFTPWPPYHPPEDKKSPVIPEWLKFSVTAVVALLAVGGYVWRGGAIVERFESLEKKVEQSVAQQDVREKQRDLREQQKDGADAKWREEMNSRLGALTLTGSRRRRAVGNGP